MKENRIEKRMAACRAAQKKALITYMTAGLPDPEACAELIRTQERAGVDILELGIPFSDPVADTPLLQAASQRAISQGIHLKEVFAMVKALRSEGCEQPLVFVMYYNTILHTGVESFVKGCVQAGVDGVFVYDLPLEEQEELQKMLDGTEGAPLLLQMVAPSSGQRLLKLLKRARGFVYCSASLPEEKQDVSAMEKLREYLRAVKAASPVPMVLDAELSSIEDAALVSEQTDGCVLRTAFVRSLEEMAYNREKIADYVGKLTQAGGEEETMTA